MTDCTAAYIKLTDSHLELLLRIGHFGDLPREWKAPAIREWLERLWT